MKLYVLEEQDYWTMLDLPDDESPGEFVEQVAINRIDGENTNDILRGLIQSNNGSSQMEPVAYVLMEDGIIIHH